MSGASPDVPDQRPSDEPHIGEARELDEFLARAVDRQIGEQRALREALVELTRTVRDLQARPASVDTESLAELVRRSGEGSVEVLGELREVREDIVARLDRAAAGTREVQTVGGEVAVLREALGGVSADIEGLAQSLIDINTGLRDWAASIEHNVAEVRRVVGFPGEDGAIVEPSGEETDVEGDDDLPAEDVAIVPFSEKVAEIDERVKETAELSLYLADQIEDFDRVIARMNELPTKLEGVIAQAVKRTLAARAKLDRDAEVVLDDVLDALDEQVTGMSGAVEQLAQSGEAIRSLSSGHEELSSRIDALHAELGVLAEAIDRAAEGRAPRAAASLRAATSKRPKPLAKSKPAAGARRKPKPKAKPQHRRKAAGSRREPAGPAEAPPDDAATE